VIAYDLGSGTIDTKAVGAAGGRVEGKRPDRGRVRAE